MQLGEKKVSFEQMQETKGTCSLTQGSGRLLNYQRDSRFRVTQTVLMLARTLKSETQGLGLCSALDRDMLQQPYFMVGNLVLGWELTHPTPG